MLHFNKFTEAADYFLFFRQSPPFAGILPAVRSTTYRMETAKGNPGMPASPAPLRSSFWKEEGVLEAGEQLTNAWQGNRYCWWLRKRFVFYGSWYENY